MSLWKRLYRFFFANFITSIDSPLILISSTTSFLLIFPFIYLPSFPPRPFLSSFSSSHLSHPSPVHCSPSLIPSSPFLLFLLPSFFFFSFSRPLLCFHFISPTIILSIIYLLYLLPSSSPLFSFIFYFSHLLLYSFKSPSPFFSHIIQNVISPKVKKAYETFNTRI